MAKGRESGMPAKDYWESFFEPGCILERLDCGGQGDVLEFGCGYGTFTVAAARRTAGKVHGLDIDPAMIAATDAAAAEAGLTNVNAVQRDFVAEGSGLPDRSVRYVMLFNILHIEEPVSLLREAWRVLEPAGRVGVIHWRHDIVTPRGPTPAIRPSLEQCRQWSEQAGFHFVGSRELSCCSWHWGMVLERTDGFAK